MPQNENKPATKQPAERYDYAVDGHGHLLGDEIDWAESDHSRAAIFTLDNAAIIAAEEPLEFDLGQAMTTAKLYSCVQYPPPAVTVLPAPTKRRRQ